ncbi:Cullin-domain-containing protein [Meira miltonrushii]|uniref:Cullin-domain-containing protein n=1 Tax=Meira miltonrushii TaxID=1280837 RepID=A0A316VQE4_9BASI|nr:Cullin-domain-containing protein [Meira miltonrushii]PWN38381.1 Cullin-domain-containing protein [Meira miltonrushii]
MEMERAVGQIATGLRASSSNEMQNDPKMHFAWLSKLGEAWKDWCERTTLVCNILVLLDQRYLLEQSELPSLWNLGMDLFKHSVCLGDEIESRIETSITQVCNMMRQTKSNEYKQLHTTLLPIFTTLDLYDSLENVLLAATRSYFGALSSASIADHSVNAYLVQADELVQQEKEYATWLYNDKAGGSKNLKIVYEQLITQHAEKLIGDLSNLLSNAENSMPALALLYAFLLDVKKLPPLRTAFGQYIREQGEKIVLDSEKDETMIERLLEYKSTIDQIVSNAFKSDEGFLQTQKDNFETFVNKRQNKPAELIAKFLDSRLRSGNKTMSDQEMEHVLNEALVLFRYTHAKDMFEEFYKRLFAKRLLLNRSASSDAEQSMLLKLKEECGAAFTQKLETMLTDIALSDEMIKAYNSSKEKILEQQGSIEPFELNVNVLTQAHWPTYPQVEIIIPQEMAAATERFAKFYETRNQGRTLHWTHSLGTTSITAQFAKAGEKELLVSTFQAVVLLLFNTLPSGAKLTYGQIKQQTGLEEKELKRTLQSLACGQIPTRVLRKEPQGKEVNESDQFAVNEQLKNERKRIRINMIQLNETQEEQKSTVDRVMFDREMVLQATAVRILKAKKTIKHAELLQEIVQAIASRFTVDVGEIKKAFEILIDKEYMERVEGQRGMYRYLA